MLDRNAARSAAGPSRLGLFGMVSAAALERVADAAAATPACSPAAAMGVYAQLAVLASQQGTASSQGQRCTVTVAELAARCRMGRRTVQTYLALLADCGVLEVDHRFDARGNPLASTLVFAYPRRDAPPAAGDARGAAPAASPEAPPAAPSAAPLPGEGYAAGGARILERGDKEQRDDSLTRIRGADGARTYLREKLGWLSTASPPRTPPGAGVPQHPAPAARLPHADGVG